MNVDHIFFDVGHKNSFAIGQQHHCVCVRVCLRNSEPKLNSLIKILPYESSLLQHFVSCGCDLPI